MRQSKRNFLAALTVILRQVNGRALLLGRCPEHGQSRHAEESQGHDNCEAGQGHSLRALPALLSAASSDGFQTRTGTGAAAAALSIVARAARKRSRVFMGATQEGGLNEDIR